MDLHQTYDSSENPFWGPLFQLYHCSDLFNFGNIRNYLRIIMLPSWYFQDVVCLMGSINRRRLVPGLNFRVQWISEATSSHFPSCWNGYPRLQRYVVSLRRLPSMRTCRHDLPPFHKKRGRAYLRSLQERHTLGWAGGWCQSFLRSSESVDR